MNKERLSTIADWLEAGGDSTGCHKFNMAYWDNGQEDYTGTACGTAMCIGGAADAFFGGEVAESLGLDNLKTHALCHPSEIDMSWDKITPQAAATVVRHLITFGVVDWRLAEDHMGETE